MIRDFLVPVAEVLFWLTGGVQLADTVWVFVWVVVGSLLTAAPALLAVNFGNNRANSFPAVVFLISFFPLLMLAIGPPLVQHAMLNECRTMPVDISIDGRTETTDVKQCRSKGNFYDTEFGEWRTVSLING
jgi:hypothetical protein